MEKLFPSEILTASGEVEEHLLSTNHGVSRNDFLAPSVPSWSISTIFSRGCKLLLGVAILASYVLNKLTLVSLTDSLQYYSENHSNEAGNVEDKDVNKVVILYWQFLLILLVPNAVTFLRCFCFGWFGKSNKSFPWPRCSAVIGGCFSAVMEVAAMSLLLFVVFPGLSPGLSIFVLSGVFILQTLADGCYAYPQCFRRNRAGYSNIDSMDHQQNMRMNSHRSRKHMIFDNLFFKMTAIIMQFLGISGLVSFLVYMMIKGSEKSKLDETYLRPIIGLPIVLIVLSVIWMTSYQKAIARANRDDKKEDMNLNINARYKSSLINSGLRILLYPFVTYIIFRYATPFEVDPWCIHGECTIGFSGDTRNVMIAHIVISFIGYLLVWISCTSRVGIGISLLLSTPIAILCYYCSIHANNFLNFYNRDLDWMQAWPIASGIALWLGELISMGAYIVSETNIILAEDKDMFLMPHYNSIFLEQQTILNRQGQNRQNERSRRDMETRNPRTIYICSTMYRETDYEMKRMLKSIFRFCRDYNEIDDKYESHIFFDGAISANQIEKFGLQLLALLEDTLYINLTEGEKKKTPYGYRLHWKINGSIPFYIHFKDKTKVKAGKRWSQVMYMNYVLNYRAVECGVTDTFILTTDADIAFKAKSVATLLDMLESKATIAAVCARTHPKGQGVIYWYQLFDYAIGHWFQKPAEHMLGSVLCAPGCFSLFRCSALEKVYEEYSSEVHGATEFLMKDMGEDRWLSTLLIKKGYRLEYCAISEDLTNCPAEFNELFKQRRRWIPSTVANLILLIRESIPIMKGNDSISVLYILYQVVMVLSIVISPATVILVIAAGLETFGVPYQLTITFLFILSVIYGLVCLVTSPKTQLDISKLLTFFFAVIMSVVVVGIFKDIVYAIVGEPNKIPLTPGNCDGFIGEGNQTEEYIACMRGLEIAANLTNGGYDHFRMPVPVTVIYIAGLSITFFFAAVLHLPEIACLIHSIWFLLGLPTGYLLLLIYSAANLSDRSWGTREQSSGSDEGLWKWRVYVIKAWRVITCCVSHDKIAGIGEGKGENEVAKDEKEREKLEGFDEADGSQNEDQNYTESTLVKHAHMDEDVRQWLRSQECEGYEKIFEANGYKKLTFLASMTMKDFEEIGIDKRGFRLRLERAVKKLPSLQYEYIKGCNVTGWLRSLELEEYAQVFRSEGFRTRDDIPNVKKLNKEWLQKMGIVRRAHLQRMLLGIECLKNSLAKIVTMDSETRKWLSKHDSEEYTEQFCAHGYTSKKFIAGISAQDLKEIGVDKKGFRLKLEKAAQQLAPLTIKVDIPRDIETWLEDLELSEYTELFHSEGFRTGEDVVNLKDLDDEQLKVMGITKKAHLQRLKTALASLQFPSYLEENKRRTMNIIDALPSGTLDETEEDFWSYLTEGKLKPVPLKFTNRKSVEKSLQDLRNTALAVLLLVNLMWIVMLSSLSFHQLEKYNLEPRAFHFLFFALYGLIILIQFCGMLVHRVFTLIHYIGRKKTLNESRGLTDESIKLEKIP